MPIFYTKPLIHDFYSLLVGHWTLWYGKVPKKEKKIAKENDFLMFGCSIKNTKEKKT